MDLVLQCATSESCLNTNIWWNTIRIEGGERLERNNQTEGNMQEECYSVTRDPVQKDLIHHIEAVRNVQKTKYMSVSEHRNMKCKYTNKPRCPCSDRSLLWCQRVSGYFAKGENGPFAWTVCLQAITHLTHASNAGHNGVVKEIKLLSCFTEEEVNLIVIAH